jgi:hypothetical protein
MERTAGVEPLESRQQTKILTHAEKLKRLPDHPLHRKLQDPFKNRLKRKRLNHLVKELQRDNTDILIADPDLQESLTSS